MSYEFLRDVHLATVLLSISLFIFRGALMVIESPLLSTRVLNILPHAIDTVLLGSALWLCLLIGQYPGSSGWLTAKMLGLAAYVVLGSIALKRGRTRAQRFIALALALLALAYVIGVARHHHALAWWG